MAQVFHNLEKTAELLGLGPADVNRMRESNELHGYRDGSDWKFKAEDVEAMVQKLKAEKEAPSAQHPADSEGDVLLSELELGQSDPGASGTVIGGPKDKGKSVADSDIQLVDSGIKLGGSDIDPAGAGQDSGKQDAADSGLSDSGLSDFEELDLTLEEDLTLEDSQISPGERESAEAIAEKKPESGSAVDLSAEGEGLADDDLVLGGSGSGSDITIGGDSGISLVDPADSGLSLEEPLELAGGGEESLELGEDDMISLAEETDTESPTELKTDGDFLLTPMDDGSGDEDSESGSQVIALDTESTDEAATMIGSMAAGSMPPMLDEDLGAEPDLGIDMGTPLGDAGAEGAPLGAPRDLAGGQPLMEPAAALPETPYSVWNVLALALCAIFLVLSGMMMYDLMRNMWSWGSPYPVNSSLMDAILGMFEG